MELSQPILKPVILKNILILSPGRWNDVDYTELEIQKAFNNTDWNDRKFTSLYLDHQDTKERGVGNWVGYIKNQRMENSSLVGDLEIWNPMIGAFLAQAKAKFGISATLAGRENKQMSKMEDFHFESFSIVTDPACKPAMINLDKVNMVQDSDVKVVTMENEVKEVVELESVKHKQRREDSEFVKEKKEHPSFSDEQIDQIVKDHNLCKEELGAKFERQVSHIKDSLKKSHPEWSEEKIKSVAYATANKFKENNQEMPEFTNLSSEQIQAWISEVVLTEKSDSDSPSRKENSDEQVKGGYKKPEMENESVKVALETTPVETKIETAELVKEPKAEPKSEDKKAKADKDKDKDKEKEMSKDAILNKIKEMSAEELVSYTNFVKAYLSEHNSASAKEVTLAYEKSKVESSPKELSASDLLASIDARIASLKELDSTKTIAKMDSEIKELQAKVKTPDRKTLSVAFDNASAHESNVGMLNFLQHRIS